MAFRSVVHNVYGLVLLGLLLLSNCQHAEALAPKSSPQEYTAVGRQRVSINTGWRFWRTTDDPDHLVYDNRPDTVNRTDLQVLKPWILPAANDFIVDPANHYQRPDGNPGGNISFVQKNFDDSEWEAVNLPHDWAITLPFYTDANPIIGGGMGRLPVHGIGWYRKKLSLTSQDVGKTIYLEIDGAMSYAMVWLNGNLVGGWPYGYGSFRIDITPYLKKGSDNQLAIRLDNPVDSSRWYPGGGLYRNVWLTKVNPAHVAQWGTYISTSDVSAQSATVDLAVQIQNSANSSQDVQVSTEIHVYNSNTRTTGAKVADFPSASVSVAAGQTQSVNQTVTLKNPRLWGPPPTQQPNLYVAVTRVSVGKKVVDTYETRFGVRSLTFDSNQGILVNGELIRLRGSDQHHDLGALGSAFHIRAAERHLEILQGLGSNAIRMSHNPPAPELLDMTDEMGFLILDEIFDCWNMSKTSADFHLIFPDWHEADLRAFIRRDRNHPSVIAWSFGNEVGEQTQGDAGYALAKSLHDIVHEEDNTRLATSAMNQAQPSWPFPQALDIIALNYQGEGIRNGPAYSYLLTGIHTTPMYPAFHAAFPNEVIFSSETASALSTRGTYLFPVTSENSSPINDTHGGNSTTMQVSAYELYTSDFGASPDKVFAAQDQNLYVAGEFVWSGWDYMGEPTPYYSARSSYSGFIDLAGFLKDRAYLYMSRWRPDLKMAHILPHWTWPDRVGLVTPVHVFSAGDEAELFVNGKSQGRLTKAAYTYRFRWDNVTYEAGELHVVTYKNGTQWATDTVRTAGAAAKMQMSADRSVISADGYDLSYITVKVLDNKGVVVPEADNAITFSVSGAGELLATDNGNPADMNAFPSKTRNAFSGLALAIVRSKAGDSGRITVTATGEGLQTARVIVVSE